MSMFEKSQCGNHWLRLLPDIVFAALAPALKRVELRAGHILVEPGQPIETVYFLEDGVASVVMTMAGIRTEVGVFGREGVSGVTVLLGSDRTPLETFMQIDGTSALIMDAQYLRRIFDEDAVLRELLLRYVQSFMLQVAASVVSNAHNRVEARLARWVLMCHDRLDGDKIKLTHQFMSMMLATQRTRVTMTLHNVEGTGAIRSSRGCVTVLDRTKLEELAGESYGQPEAEYRRLVGPFGRSVQATLRQSTEQTSPDGSLFGP
jgi:CRP-like cAMP-binding protein